MDISVIPLTMKIYAIISNVIVEIYVIFRPATRVGIDIVVLFI